MKNIKYIILVAMLWINMLLIFPVQLHKYTYPNYYNIAIQNLDTNKNKRIVINELSKYLEQNNLEIFTYDGQVSKKKIIYNYYSSFTAKSFYEDYYRLHNMKLPQNNEFVANFKSSNDNQIGIIKKYSGKNEIIVKNMTNLEHASLNRIYYFPEISSKNINDIKRILDTNKILYTMNNPEKITGINIGLVVIELTLVILMLILYVVEQLLRGKEITIKSFNGYSKYRIIYYEIKKYIKNTLKLNALTLMLMSLLMWLKIDDILFIKNVLKLYIFWIFKINVLIIFVMVIIICTMFIFIDVSKVKNYINSDVILLFTFVSKFIILIIICTLVGYVVMLSPKIANIKQQFAQWYQLENYYTTNYRNLTSNINEEIDFNTFKLDKIDEESKKFIDKTTDEYNGVIIDSHAYGPGYEINKQVCKDDFSLDCNTLVINQNYLDLAQIKDENNKSINITNNEQVDIIIPYEQKDNINEIKKKILKNINDISPVLNYQQNDFNVIVTAPETCFPTYTLQTKNPCISSVSIEFSEYYYNYNQLLTSGYFFELENNTNSYKQISDYLKENNLNYHFNIIQNKTTEVYDSYAYFKAQITEIISLMLICILIYIIVIYCAMRVYITAKAKEISIKMINGRSIFKIQKKLMVLNLIIYAMIMLSTHKKNYEVIISTILLVDLIFSYVLIRRIMLTNVVNYIRGYTD